MATITAESEYNRIASIDNWEEKRIELARLKISNPKMYEQIKGMGETGKLKKVEFNKAEDMATKAQTRYRRIKQQCGNDNKQMLDAVNEIRAKGNDKGDLLVACANADGKKWNIKKEKQQKNTEQSATATKEKSAQQKVAEYEDWLNKYGSVGYISPKGREGAVKDKLQRLAKENYEVYDTLVKGVSAGKFKVSDDLKGIVSEFAKQREIEDQSRTDKGKLYETVDKDLRALKTPEEKKAFATRLETYSKQKGYTHEYYKAAVVLVANKEYPEDVENLVREADKKAKERAAKANEGSEGKGGKEGQAGSGRSGGTGSRAGGNSTRTTGNMTLDRACSYGPTALMEFIEQDLGHPIDASNKRKGKTGNDYVPTSKMKAIVAGLSAEDRAELEEFVKSDKFQQRVDEINARDQYTPSSRSAAGNGSRAAGEKPSLEDGGVEVEFKPKEKAEPKLTREQAAESNTPILADMNVLKNLPTAEKMRIIASSSIPVPEGLSIDDQLALVVKAELDKTKGKDEKPKEEKPKELTPEEKARLEKFEQYKKICKENPNLYDNMKLNAKNAGMTADVKIMEEVEKYVKLEKQMQKDQKKAQEKMEKAEKARANKKEDKAKKLEEKAAKLNREAAAKKAQMDALESGKDIKAAMKTDTKAAEAQSSEGKKGNIFQRAGRAISNTASNVGNAVSNTASGIVNKVAKKKVELTVDGDKTTYKLSGFEGKNLEDSSKLCNGIYTYDKASDKIYYQEKEGVEPTRFDFEDEKDCTEYLRALGNAYSSYGKSAPTQIRQQGNER